MIRKKHPAKELKVQNDPPSDLIRKKNNATKDESCRVQLKRLRVAHAGEYNPQLEIQNDIRTMNCSAFPVLLGGRESARLTLELKTQSDDLAFSE